LVLPGIQISKPLQMLTSDELRSIHYTTLEILEKVGIQLNEKRTLNLLKDSGADVDFKKKIARIPKHLVEEAVRKAPHRYKSCGRNPRSDIMIGKNSIHWKAGGTQMYVIDSKNKTRRYATLKDLEVGTRIMDALENIHSIGAPGTGHWVIPQDVPLKIRDLYCWKILFENSGKPVAAWIFSKESARILLKMAAMIVGDEEKLRKRPIIGYECEATSPLQYATHSLEIVWEMASYGFPVFFAPMPMAGVTAPVTLAGTLVVHNAEVLSGIIVTQLIHPGTPCVYGATAHTADMRTGQISCGSIENSLLAVGLVQLSKFYGLPSYSFWGTTDSNVFDAQAGFEIGMSSLFPALAGCNSTGNFGALGADQGASLEAMVASNDIMGYINRIIKSIKVDENTLALDTIRKVGIGHHYLAQKHTRENLLKEHFFPMIFERGSWDLWVQRGSRDVVERAREKAEDILNTHQPEPISNEVKEELENLLRSAEKQLTHER